MRIIPVLVVLALGVAVQAQDFTETMTPAEQAAAGLGKLTPAELAVLKAAIERYKSGEVAAVRQEAEQKVAQAESRVAEKSKEERRRGYFAALFKTGDQAEFAIESTLPGRHDSFDGKPLLVLANGQRWKVIETVRYFGGRELVDPAVKIEPGLMGSFWLTIEGGPRLRVEPAVETRRK